jgi:hypothetical protein
MERFQSRPAGVLFAGHLLPVHLILWAEWLEAEQRAVRKRLK